jgi:hypothetical protein
MLNFVAFDLLEQSKELTVARSNCKSWLPLKARVAVVG